MELKWNYDPSTRISKTVITDNLYYTTKDGGQTIHKYVNDQLVRTLHKYGPDNKFTETGHDGLHIDVPGLDDWIDEIKWIAETYPDIVGPLLRDWENGYLNKDGNIEDVGVHRGMGVLSAENPISINRIGQPASIQEMWDYDVIAYTEKDVAEDCRGMGTKWVKHKETGQIYRMGAGEPPFPCCAFPTVHGPWPVDENDITKHGGKFLSILAVLFTSKKLIAIGTGSVFILPFI